MQPGQLVKVWLTHEYGFAEVVSEEDYHLHTTREKFSRTDVPVRWFNERRNISPVPYGMIEAATALELLARQAE